LSYISVDFLLDKLYIKEFDINSNIINRVNEDFLSKLYIKDISGSFNVLKSNEKIKEITIPLSKYSSKRQEFLVDGINLYNDFLPNYQYISDFHYNKTKDLIDLNFFYFDFKVFEVANIDIENPKYEIRTIELFENITNKKYLFTIKKINEVKEDLNNKEIFVFSSEKTMLEEFINFIYKKDPIMLVSWFGDSFYFPYLINRCKKLNVDYLKLSPFEKFKTITKSHPSNYKSFIETLRLLNESKISFEVRTTFHDKLLSLDDIYSMLDLLESIKYRGIFYIQDFILGKNTFGNLDSSNGTNLSNKIKKKYSFKIRFRNF